MMDVKQAVGAAKAHVVDLFGDERPTNIGLEEVVYDHEEECWLVTIGFTRPWDGEGDGFIIQYPRPRTYKIVAVSDDGRILFVKNRELAAA